MSVNSGFLIGAAAAPIQVSPAQIQTDFSVANSVLVLAAGVLSVLPAIQSRRQCMDEGLPPDLFSFIADDLLTDWPVCVVCRASVFTGTARSRTWKGAGRPVPSKVCPPLFPLVS